MPRRPPLHLTVTERKRIYNPHQPVGRWIRVERRLALYMRDGFHCLWCNVDLSNESMFTVTLDHLVRRVDGGSNDNDNLYTSCRACNSGRQGLAGLTLPVRVIRLTTHIARDLKPYLRISRDLCAGSTYQVAFRHAQSLFPWQASLEATSA